MLGVWVAGKKNAPEKTHLDHTREEDVGRVYTRK